MYFAGYDGTPDHGVPKAFTGDYSGRPNDLLPGRKRDTDFFVCKREYMVKRRDYAVDYRLRVGHLYSYC